MLAADDHGEGGTFALYTLIARHAHISLPGTGTPNASDMHLSRYTSNQMVEGAQRQRPTTLGERVRPHRNTRPVPALRMRMGLLTYKCFS